MKVNIVTISSMNKYLHFSPHYYNNFRIKSTNILDPLYYIDHPLYYIWIPYTMFYIEFPLIYLKTPIRYKDLIIN